MRKTSQDGGDNTSITSGVENEIKKTGAIIKTKRNSIKRKVQSLSHESDDAVVEPLLQKDKEKTETVNQSAKFNLLPKTKTDFKNERESDKAKLLKEDKKQDSLLSDSQTEVNTVMPIVSSNTMPKYTVGEATLHNHMNTNVFHSPDASKGFLSSKTQVLVEIDASKHSGFNPSPLIFTTAKIHTSDKTKQMEPLQVTPVPILSTIEVSIKGAKNNSGEPSGSVTSNISTLPAAISKNNKNITEKAQNLKTSTFSPESANKIVDTDTPDKNILTQCNKGDEAAIKDLKIGSKVPINNQNNTSSKDGNYTNNKEKNEIGEKSTKTSLCQDTFSSSSNEIKSTTPSAVSKSIPVTTQATATSHDVKQTPKAQTTKMDTNVFTTSQRETDLNENILPRDNAGQSNKPVASYQNKLASTASTSGKHLQRQKYAIDKEDTPPKLQCTDNNPSPHTSKITIKSHDTGVSVTKPATKVQSSTNDVNSMNNKTISSKSTADDVNVTRPNSIKQLPVNVTSANKTDPSNSFKPHNISPTALKTTTAKVKDLATAPAVQNETTSKPLSINITSAKSTGNNMPSKPQTSMIENKPVTAVTSTTKTTNVPMVDIPKLSSNQSVANSNITNIPSTSSSKVIESTAKSPSVNTTKSSPVSTTIVGTLSLPANTINSVPISTINAKTSPILTNSSKNASLPATSSTVSKPKTTTVPTTTANTTSLPNTTKNSTDLNSTAKTSITTGTSTVTTNKASKTPTTSNNHPTSSGSVVKPVNTASTDATTKVVQPQKKNQELNNGNKNVNA